MTKQLFDLTTDSPEDVGPKRGGRKKSAIAVCDRPSPVAPTAPGRPRSLKPIGSIDGEPCGGRAFGMPCQCTVWDILYEDRGEWLVGCFVCGAVKWMPVVEGHLPDKPQGAEFVIRDGRFAGMRLEEIVDQPRGLDTLRIYAKTHKSDVVRREVGKFLDRLGRGG